LLPTVVLAEDAAGLNLFVNEFGGDLGLGSRDIRSTIANVINIAAGLLGIIFVIYMIYGGFQWLTAGGNEEYVKKAKHCLKSGIIGIILIFIAYPLAKFILDAVLKSTSDF